MTNTFDMDSRNRLDAMKRLEYDEDVMRQFKDSDAYRILYRRIFAQTQINLEKILDKRTVSPNTILRLAGETSAFQEILKFIDEPKERKRAMQGDMQYNEEAGHAQELIGEQEDMYDGLEDGVIHSGGGGTF